MTGSAAFSVLLALQVSVSTLPIVTIDAKAPTWEYELVDNPRQLRITVSTMNLDEDEVLSRAVCVFQHATPDALDRPIGTIAVVLGVPIDSKSEVEQVFDSGLPSIGELKGIEMKWEVSAKGSHPASEPDSAQPPLVDLDDFDFVVGNAPESKGDADGDSNRITSDSRRGSSKPSGPTKAPDH